VLGLAIGLQIILISYNHFSGYHIQNDLLSFFITLGNATFFTMIGGFLLIYSNLFIIRDLNRKYPWSGKFSSRLAIQLAFSVLVGIIISLLVTLIANWIKPYREEIIGVYISNCLITMVINVILMAILEGWIFYIESRSAKQVADNLRAELSQIRFEVLKSQVNPHFMFNSLNILSGLIDEENVKAQQFIDEFSQIYRYVLEIIEQPVASLRKELDFMRSYLFLQQIRYGESLSYSVNIPADLLELFLPPLSLQVVLENATKHNIVNESKPLHIEIYNEGTTLVVKNNLQSKISQGRSTGLGLKNMARRYSLISKLQPTFKIETNYYIARLPLIKIHPDEHTYN